MSRLKKRLLNQQSIRGDTPSMQNLLCLSGTERPAGVVTRCTAGDAVRIAGDREKPVSGGTRGGKSIVPNAGERRTAQFRAAGRRISTRRGRYPVRRSPVRPTGASCAAQTVGVRIAASNRRIGGAVMAGSSAVNTGYSSAAYDCLGLASN